MNKMILIATVLAVVFAVSDVFAQNTATGTGIARAKIVAPIEVTQIPNQDLNFGTIINKAGVVTVDTAGSRTSTSGNLISDSNTPSAGGMKITGPKGASVTLDRIYQTTVTGPNGRTMSVNNFQTNPPAGDITLDDSGEKTIAVGADLNVAEGQAPGDYSGEYIVSVTY